MWTKEQILEKAESELNKEDRPWSVKVEGDTIVATWKWMDATFFSPTQVTDEAKEFKFIVTLLDNGKWKEMDYSSSKSTKVGFGGFGMSSSTFIGHSYSKSGTIAFGKNKDTGETGIVKFNFDTAQIKGPIRDFLKSCGWKKKGLF